MHGAVAARFSWGAKQAGDAGLKLVDRCVQNQCLAAHDQGTLASPSQLGDCLAKLLATDFAEGGIAGGDRQDHVEGPALIGQNSIKLIESGDDRRVEVSS